MKKLNLNLLIAISLIFSLMITTSCGDDGVCTADDYVGTFIGKYAIIGIPLPNADTVNMTNLGNNKVKLQSSLLRTSFEADYDPSTGTCSVEGIDIDTLNVGTEYFAGIFVNNVSIELDASCNNLYISLNQASVDTGTIDISVIPGVDGYEDLDNVNLTTAGNGLRRQ